MNDHLNDARQRLVIFEAMALAIERRTEVADTIWSAATEDAAVAQLCERFDVTRLQAHVILDMQSRRLVADQRQHILDRLEELRRTLS